MCVYVCVACISLIAVAWQGGNNQSVKVVNRNDTNEAGYMGILASEQNQNKNSKTHTHTRTYMLAKHLFGICMWLMPGDGI